MIKSCKSDSSSLSSLLSYSNTSTVFDVSLDDKEKYIKKTFRNFDDFYKEYIVLNYLNKMLKCHQKICLQVVKYEHDDYCYDSQKNQYVIYFNYISGQTLRDFLSRHNITFIHRLIIAMNLIHAIMKIHDIGVIHKDLKPENIIINDDVNPVIIDFGSACVYGEMAPTNILYLYEKNYKSVLKKLFPQENIDEAICNDREHNTTIGYGYPNWSEEKDKRKVDVFSLGVILFDLFLDHEDYKNGYMLFGNKTDSDISLLINSDNLKLVNLNKIKYPEIKKMIELFVSERPDLSKKYIQQLMQLYKKEYLKHNMIMI